MQSPVSSRSRKSRRPKAETGRPTIGIRELKARASAIVEDVKARRVTYAVTKRGSVEALIVPVDAGERLLNAPTVDSAWEAWQTLATRLSEEQRRKKSGSALVELTRTRR